RVFAVECRNDDGKQFGHRRPLLPALAEVAHADKPLGSVHASMVTCRRLRSLCGQAIMQKMSAYILTFNEAEKIEAAVSSVLWADEVVVVDSFSVDRTAQIAR